MIEVDTSEDRTQSPQRKPAGPGRFTLVGALAGLLLGLAILGLLPARPTAIAADPPIASQVVEHVAEGPTGATAAADSPKKQVETEAPPSNATYPEASPAAAPERAPTSSYSSPYTGDRVQVRGYYRKDGTYVRPHTRSRPRRK